MAQVRRIKEWRPCFGKSSNVMVQGYLQDDNTKKLWRTSIIEYRENPKTLVTKGGGKYILVGSINKKACIERGFPLHVIEQFVDGFPDEWRDILVTQYNNLAQKTFTTTTTRNDIDHDFDHFTPPKPKKKPTKAVVPYKTTPNTVARTKSGRVVKPRTATWANQSIVYDNNGSVVEVRNPITTTRQSKKVNQNLGNLCNSLGVDTPETSQISEKSINTPPRRSVEKPKLKKKRQQNNLVGYSDSEYDSIDEESSDGLELLETGNTPIRPSKQMTKKLQQRIHALDSSIEDEGNEVPIKSEKVRKKRTATKPATKNVPAKKGKKNEPVCKGLSLKKAREQTVTPPLVDFDDHPIVEFPESDKENDAPKKWTVKEKDKFLQLLKISNPVNDYDWERFHATNKTDRTINEMKEKAKELKWKPSRVRPTEDNSHQINEITARPGTVAHIMQANKVNQNYLAAKNKNAAADEHVRQLRDANYTPIHINDSVMSMLRTPENPKKQRGGFNPTFDINLDGSSLNESSLLSSSSPSFIIPQDEQSRRREQAFGLKVLKKTNTTTRRTRTRTHGQNSTVFTDTITTTTNFIVPQLPIIKPSTNFAKVEEEYDSENEEEEEENEMDDSALDDDY